MATRALITVPPAKAGEIIEIRTTIAHPMETGLRPDDSGKVLPRNIITRFECRLDGVSVFKTEMYPAVAANPYVAFSLRAEKSGTLTLLWEGDESFRHTENVPLLVA
jgi:sulfur-oxidizing protein SoxZ